MRNTHYAVLFERKTLIPGEFFAFIPITIKGGQMEGTDIFTEEFGSTYYTWEDYMMTTDNNQPVFGLSLSVAEIKRRYPEETFQKSLIAYLDKIKYTLFFGKINSEHYRIEIKEINYTAEVLSSEMLEQVVQEDSNKENNTQNFIMIEPEKIASLVSLNDAREFQRQLKAILKEYNSLSMMETTEPEPKPQKKATKKATKNTGKIPFDVEEMFKYVSSRVIHQDEAIKQIIMTLTLNNIMTLQDENYHPSHSLLVGPTGSGKTMIFEKISEYLSAKLGYALPMAKIATSQLTSAGYVGQNLEDIIEALMNSSSIEIDDMDKKRSFVERNGIVFLDEIDKKGSSKNDDIAGRGVLNALLQFLDGSDYKINYNKTSLIFNTRHLNIFAAGAFTHVAESKTKQVIGFNSETGIPSLDGKMNVQNLIQQGQMPSEFMGRFHNIIQLNPLGEKELENILINSQESPLKIQIEKLKALGTTLKYDETFITAVAKQAAALNLGGRSLTSIIERLFHETVWTCLIEPKQREIVVTEDFINSQKQLHI